MLVAVDYEILFCAVCGIKYVILHGNRGTGCL